MSQYLEQAGLFNQVIRLKPEQCREPRLVLDKFFTDYRLHEWRHYLWSMVEACLTTGHPDYQDPAARADLLHRYNDLEKLLEAAFLINQRENNSKETPEK